MLKIGLVNDRKQLTLDVFVIFLDVHPMPDNVDNWVGRLYWIQGYDPSLQYIMSMMRMSELLKLKEATSCE